MYRIKTRLVAGFHKPAYFIQKRYLWVFWLDVDIYFTEDMARRQLKRRQDFKTTTFE
jgi:hypothetical protein